MDARRTAAHVEHFERHGWVLIAGLLAEAEIDTAHPGLFELYPRPEEFHAGAPIRAARCFATAPTRRPTRATIRASGHSSSSG